MSYMRVVPRDLFNESKLLKCIGKLVLFAQDYPGKGLYYHHDGEAFNVMQDTSDGSLFIGNISFWADGNDLRFSASYNSKEAWPLILTTETDSYSVFDATGNLTLDFTQVL